MLADVLAGMLRAEAPAFTEICNGIPVVDQKLRAIAEARLAFERYNAMRALAKREAGRARAAQRRIGGGPAVVGLAELNGMVEGLRLRCEVEDARREAIRAIVAALKIQEAHACGRVTWRSGAEVSAGARIRRIGRIGLMEATNEGRS